MVHLLNKQRVSFRASLFHYRDYQNINEISECELKLLILERQRRKSLDMYVGSYFLPSLGQP